MSAWDLHVHSVFVENRSDLLTWLVVPFTKATGPTAMAIIAIVVSLILYLSERRKGSPRLLVFLPAVGVLLANGTSYVLKRLINRHRPPLEDQLLYHFNPSMPSGHAVGAFALATAVALVFKKSWTLLCFCIAAGVATSRLYVGVHWLSDVVVGALVGCAVSLLAWWSLTSRDKREVT